MVVRLGRIAFGAAVGVALGGLFWLRHSALRISPHGLGDPFGIGEQPVAFFMMWGAGLGAGLVLILDAIGLELPLIAVSGRSESDLWIAMEAARAAARRPVTEAAGTRDPTPPRTLLLKTDDRDAHPDVREFILPQRAERLRAGLASAQFRVALLASGAMLGAFGFGLLLLHAVTAGALGDPISPWWVMASSFVPYAIVLWIGGSVWRVMALTMIGFTAWLLWALATL